MATYSNNTTVKIYGAASSGQVLSAGQYAIASYEYAGSLSQTCFNIYYGPGQTISATRGGGLYTFISGVVFQNSP